MKRGSAMRAERANRIGRGVWGLVILGVVGVLAGCTQTRTVVITNGSDTTYRLRSEGSKTAIVVDPGGSTTIRVRAGEPMEIGDTIVQVY